MTTAGEGAETLRAAAALMRERAEAATNGPWFVPRRGTGIDAGDYETVIGGGPVDCMAYCYGGSSTIDGDNLTADQSHIASWHPAVALAVADWLDRLHGFITSSEYDQDVDLLNALDGLPDSPPLSDWPEVESALAVARTYLGQQP